MTFLGLSDASPLPTPSPPPTPRIQGECTTTPSSPFVQHGHTIPATSSRSQRIHETSSSQHPTPSSSQRPMPSSSQRPTPSSTRHPTPSSSHHPAVSSTCSDMNRDLSTPLPTRGRLPPAPFHQGYIPGPKPKAADYEDGVERMLLRAMHEYACLILSTDAFPNKDFTC